jgi:chaperone required for assembly of F1-ATPase
MPQKPETKRFYNLANVAGASGGFAIQLDGRTVKTPAGAPLRVPTRALADAIAREWNDQGQTIKPETLPLTRLANSAIDGVAGRDAEVATDILNYSATDLICYRAEYPEALVEAQRRAWDPILGWVKQHYGAEFRTGTGIGHVEQPAAALDALKAALQGFGAFKLAALHVIASLTGSALIALALAGGGIAPDVAWKAAHVDEDWQASRWGEDFEAAQRRGGRFADFENAWRFFQLA